MSMDQFERKVQKTEEEFDVAEVKVYLQTGGFIAGRFWGDKTVKPFVCLHGWLDNAGSFDRLIPLLPKQHSYLAIDFPGHGKSSWLPNGVAYHNFDFVYVLIHLMKEYNWDKISLIGHSMGAYVAFLFASIFPNKVDVVINIDAIRPIIVSTNILLESLKDSIENTPLADQRNQEGHEKDYSFEELIDRTLYGTFNSVTKETAPYLLRRGAVPSRRHPGKFCFSRDARLRHNFGFNLGRSMYNELAKDIKVPFLIVKAGKFPLIEDRVYYEETLNILKKNNKHFEYHEADAVSHHLHLTEPEKVADLIRIFIEKHKKLLSHL